MAQRTDPSSLRFSRRLARAEFDAAQARQELSELKQSLPSSQAMQSAALTGEVLKQQRKIAKQAIADMNTSYEDLASINPAVLTPAFQEQLRMRKRDMLLANEMQKQSVLPFATPAAMQRIENFKSQRRMTSGQQQNFAANNLWQDQPTQFERWDARQRSLAGRTWNEQQRRAEYESAVTRAKTLAQSTTKSKAGGKYYGGIRDLNDI